MNVRDEHVVPRLTTAAEYRAVIAALDSSTRAIEVHLDASRKVLEVSKKQLQTNPQGAPNRAEPHAQRKQTSRHIESLRNSIVDKHGEISADLQKFVAAILITTDDTLARHDHEFGHLEKDQLESPGATSRQRDERASNLIGALQHCIAETIRVKLDRIYLGALRQDTNGSHDQAADTKIDVVQEDLRVLHSEIEDIAQMLVMQQYGNELGIANQKLKKSEDRWTDARAQKSFQQLESMNGQLDTLIERAELLLSHRELQRRLATFLDSSQTMPSSRQLSPVKAATGVLARPNVSLTALKQCLSVDGPNYNDKIRADRIDSMFVELIEHVNSSLSLQDSHFDHFEDYAALQSTEGNALPSNTKLNEVDELIATMKTKMDEL